MTDHDMTDTQATKQLWKEWNAQGFIPGPEETEADFATRIAYCQNLEQHLIQQTGAKLPFAKGDEAPNNMIEEAMPLAEELYGIAPRWVPLFLSNHQLSPWHGGCAWIFQLDNHTPTAAFLQLRAQFRHSTEYLKIYRRKELIVHEMAHVGRMMYHEPQFEEMLAYQSSSSSWRRWLGPIVQSSRETLWFIILLGIVILSDFALISVGIGSDVWAWSIKLAPLFLIVLALGRLWLRHRMFNRCLQNLETFYPCKIARHIVYRLRDSEIEQFAHLPPSELQNTIETLAITSFRWHFLTTLYPSNVVVG